MPNIERIIKEVSGSMAIEGMNMTNEDKNRLRICLEDQKQLDNTIEALVHKYSKQVIKKV